MNSALMSCFGCYLLRAGEAVLVGILITSCAGCQENPPLDRDQETTADHGGIPRKTLAVNNTIDLTSAVLSMDWNTGTPDLFIATTDSVLRYDRESSLTPAPVAEQFHATFALVDGISHVAVIELQDKRLVFVDLNDLRTKFELEQVHGWHRVGPEVLFTWSSIDREARFWSLSSLREIEVFSTEEEAMNALHDTNSKSSGFVAFASETRIGQRTTTSILEHGSGSLYATGRILLLKEIHFELQRGPYLNGWQWTTDSDSLTLDYFENNNNVPTRRIVFESHFHSACAIAQEAEVAVVCTHGSDQEWANFFDVTFVDLKDGDELTKPLRIDGGFPFKASISEDGRHAAIEYSRLDEVPSRIAIVSLETESDLP